MREPTEEPPTTTEGEGRAAPTAGAPEPRRVRAMFDGIAGRYDLLNHVLSMQMDRLWRRRAASRIAAALAARGERGPARILDLCTGTGDLLLAHRRRSPAASVVGADFALEMLRHARTKGPKDCPPPLVGSDALALPFRDEAFDAITVAFGVRNLADRAVGFAEMRRVLRPGGALLVLEFTPAPPTAFGTLYTLYSKHVLPRIGGLLSPDRSAYRYLPESVARFPDAEGLRDELRRAGFEPVEVSRMAMGTVAMHVGFRRDEAPGGSAGR